MLISFVIPCYRSEKTLPNVVKTIEDTVKNKEGFTSEIILVNDCSPDNTWQTIRELTELVAKVVGYEGEIRWDTSKPNGTPRKLLDVSKADALGWHYKTELEEGIRLSYEDFLNNPMRAER